MSEEGAQKKEGIYLPTNLVYDDQEVMISSVTQNLPDYVLPVIFFIYLCYIFYM